MRNVRQFRYQFLCWRFPKGVTITGMAAYCFDYSGMRRFSSILVKNENGRIKSTGKSNGAVPKYYACPAMERYKRSFLEHHQPIHI